MKRNVTRTTKRTLGTLLLGLLLACGAPALAQEASVKAKARQPRLSLGAEALSEFPLQVGGRIWVELPGRILVGTSLGYLPGAYESAVNNTLVSAGAYDAATGEVIGAVMEDSLVWRVSLGWRPFSNHGAYLRAGYMLAFLETALTPDLVQAAAGSLPVPTSLLGSYLEGYAVETTLHMINAEIGWQWVVGPGLSLRCGLGAALTVGSSSTVTGSNSHSRQVAALLAPTEAYIDDTLTSYVFTPTVTLALGWQVGLL